MTTTPPGWYDDGHGAQRWWDGERWTDHVHTPDAAVPGETAAAAPDGAAPAGAVADDAPPTEADPADADPADAVADDALSGDAPPDDAVSGVALPEDALSELTGDSAPTLRADGDPFAMDMAHPAEAAPGAAPASGELLAQDAASVSTAPPPAPGPAVVYPGFAPGVTPSGGVFADAAAPKKSKLWILWVVLGVVVVGLVVLGIILIPLLVSALGGSGQNEKAAVASVKLYDEAWNTGDCDKFDQATTESFRTEIQITDCETFQAQSAAFTDATDDYKLVVTEVSTDDDVIAVETTETYKSFYDASGNLVDEPILAEDHFVYSVVSDDGRWAIDSIGQN